MAIDSAEKRKSISGIMLMIAGVTPNAAKDAEWRLESGRSYSGIAAAAGGGDPGGGSGVSSTGAKKVLLLFRRRK